MASFFISVLALKKVNVLMKKRASNVSELYKHKSKDFFMISNSLVLSTILSNENSEIQEILQQCHSTEK